MRDKFLGVIANIIFLQHQISIVSQVITNFVRNVAEALKSDVLCLLEISITFIDLEPYLLDLLVELNDLPKNINNRFL
jgi:hypothetical protein